MPMVLIILYLTLDLNEISDDTVKELCTGSQVFFNCLGTTRKQAGSAVCDFLALYIALHRVLILVTLAQKNKSRYF